MVEPFFRHVREAVRANELSDVWQGEQRETRMQEEDVDLAPGDRWRRLCLAGGGGLNT